MFEFIKRLQDRQTEKTTKAQTDRERYLQLVRKGGTGGTLSNAETEELAGLAEALSIPPERVEADADIFRQWAAQKAIAATEVATTKSHKSATAAREAYETETNRIYKERADGLAVLVKQQAEARMPMEAAWTASTAAREIEAQHWQLFGRPDPAIAKARRAVERRIMYGTDANRAANSNDRDVIWIEDKIQHAHLDRAWDNFDNFEFILADGQSPEELAHFIEILNIAAKANGSATYIAMLRSHEHPELNGDQQMSRSQRSLTRYVEELPASQSWKFFTYLRSPGQSESDLAKLVGMLKEKNEKYLNNANPKTTASA